MLLSSTNTKSSSSSGPKFRTATTPSYKGQIMRTSSSPHNNGPAPSPGGGGGGGGGMLSGLGSLSGILGAVMPLLESFNTRSSLMQSSKLVQQGADIEARGYRDAAKAAVQAANYNNETDARNTKYNVNVMSREAMQVLATQHATAGASGFSSASRSFLSVMDATLDDYNRAFTQERINLQSRQTAVLFEAATQAQALENQAITAEWRAKVEMQKMKSQMPSMLSAVMGALGGLGGIMGGQGQSGGLMSAASTYYAPAKSASQSYAAYGALTKPFAAVQSSIQSKGLYMPKTTNKSSGYAALTRK